jgi:hypothetical protein
MSRRVLHVDTAATWRGGQNQVLLTARGMAGRGVEAAIACRAGGELEARARAGGAGVRPLPFRGDLWPPAIVALARVLRRERPGALRCTTRTPCRPASWSRLAGRAALSRSGASTSLRGPSIWHVRDRASW